MRSPRFARAVTWAVALLGLAAAASAQEWVPRSPISAFRHLSATELASVAIKTVGTGNSLNVDREPPPRLFAVDTARASLEAFYGIDPRGFAYLEFRPPDKVPLSTAEARAAIDIIAATPTVADGGIDDEAYVSLSVIATIAGRRTIFESMMNQESGIALYRALRWAWRDNPHALERLTRRGGDYGFNEAGPKPSWLSGDDAVVGRFRWDGRERRYISIVSVRNSTQRVRGKVFVVFDTAPGVWIHGASGISGRCHPPGKPYVIAPGPKVFERGPTRQFLLRLSNPERVETPIRATYVYYGDGEP